MDVTIDNPYRQVSLVNNRKNNRHLGKGGPGAPRKIQTKSTDGTCKLRFTIKWDCYGYYVYLERNTGNHTHTGHPRPLNPKETPIPTRLLSDEAINDVKHITESHTSARTARNFIYKKFGQFIASAKIAYLASKNDDGSMKKSDDIHNMLDMFESSNEVRFTSLSDVPLTQYYEIAREEEDLATDEQSTQVSDTITMSLTKDENNNIIQEDLKESSTLGEIADLAKEERKARKMKKKDELFISIAWTVMPLF
ncbi:hypothetical protein ACHAXR_004319 [Thalassiosira sp. AJA248-18]